MTRRRAAVVGLVAALLALLPSMAYADGNKTATKIKHFVFLFQENHTFDNYFGTRPGVDGIPAGTCMPVEPGTPKPCVKPHWIGNDPIIDLGHTRVQFDRELNHGKMDGFVKANSDNDRDGAIAMGHYDDRDLPYYWNLADQYVLFDRFFSSAKAGSVANHMFAVTASPGVTGTKESIPRKGWGDLPTIFDRLEAAGVSWKFYIENYDPTITYKTRDRVELVDRAAQVIWAPVLAYQRFVEDPKLNKHIVDLDQYYTDAQHGTLPAVSYIVPSGDSEHPPGRIQAGQRLVRALVNELMRSSAWDSSAFLWSYDDWGGWYDHVKPPRVDKWGYGFRVPALLVSPYARKGYVDHETSDFTSILKFIETNWNLAPMTARDRKANDLKEAFDFGAPARAPVILSTSRHVAHPMRPDTRPVYGVYALAMFGSLGLFLFARRRTNRLGAHPKALPTDAMISRRDRP
jgi:phospholipase C